MSPMKTAGTLAIAFVAGLVVAATPLYLQLRDLEQRSSAETERLRIELGQAQSKLTVSSIHSQLGLLAATVRSGDFAAARPLSGRFYDAAAKAAASVEHPDARRRLLTLVETRDQVTAALATEDPLIVARLDQLFQLLAGSL